MKNYIKNTVLLTLVAFGSVSAYSQAAPSAPAPKPNVLSPEPSMSQTAPTSAQLLSRVAIEALSTEYFYLLDHGQADKLADLFTEDGQMNGMVGRAAIAKFYGARPKTRTTRHVSTNLRVVFEGDDRARCVRTLTYFAYEAGESKVANPAVAEYRETVVRGSDGRWRFASRNIEPIFDKRP